MNEDKHRDIHMCTYIYTYTDIGTYIHIYTNIKTEEDRIYITYLYI